MAKLKSYGEWLSAEQRELTAQENDKFRRTVIDNKISIPQKGLKEKILRLLGMEQDDGSARLLLLPEVQKLEPDHLRRVLEEVQEGTNFAGDVNDLHRSGSVEVDDQLFDWSIDCFDGLLKPHRFPYAADGIRRLYIRSNNQEGAGGKDI